MMNQSVLKTLSLPLFFLISLFSLGGLYNQQLITAINQLGPWLTIQSLPIIFASSLFTVIVFVLINRKQQGKRIIERRRLWFWFIVALGGGYFNYEFSINNYIFNELPILLYTNSYTGLNILGALRLGVLEFNPMPWLLHIGLSILALAVAPIILNKLYNRSKKSILIKNIGSVDNKRLLYQELNELFESSKVGRKIVARLAVYSVVTIYGVVMLAVPAVLHDQSRVVGLAVMDDGLGAAKDVIEASLVSTQALLFAVKEHAYEDALKKINTVSRLAPNDAYVLKIKNEIISLSKFNKGVLLKL